MYQKYGDRVAFIALSTYAGDDLESIAEYRDEHGISFPMGRDEDNELWEFYTGGTPVTVIVDRFRNVVFIQDGAFRSDEDVERLIEKFLGDGYTHTTVLESIPRESDETGTITFTGPKDVYHVQIVDAPDGYSWDESYEMYTTEAYGEWVLRVRKD